MTGMTNTYSDSHYRIRAIELALQAMPNVAVIDDLITRAKVVEEYLKGSANG